jgi:hypothetical protein
MYIFLKEYFTRYLIYLLVITIKLHHYGTSYRCADDLKYFLAMLLRNLCSSLELVSLKSLANYANPFSKPLRIPSAGVVCKYKDACDSGILWIFPAATERRRLIL